MISTIASAVVALLTQFLPLITSSTHISSIISTLIALIPAVAQEAADLIVPIKNIIAQLQNNGAVTPEQIVALQVLDKQCDDAFEAAAQAAGEAPE